MFENYGEYIQEIKKESSEIPEHNLLFWGLWHCDRLYSIGRECIEKRFSKEINTLIQDIMSVFGVLIDQPEQENRALLNHYFESLEDVDESELDQLEYQENALYELIYSLDSLLNFCIDRCKGFEYSLTQSMMNVIDSKLQDGNIDILTMNGFRSPICQNEIFLQFQLINKLKVEKLRSDSKRLYRE